MSRIGKQPIALPAGVQITVEDRTITVKGPKGTLTRPIPGNLTIRQEDSNVLVERPTDGKEDRSLHGLMRTLVANMVEGVTKGYERILEVHGVGYRAAMSGANLSLGVGFSHGIEIAPRPGIQFEAGVDTATRTPFVIVRGIDKELVGLTAAQIRSLRKPEPYKGKGIRYRGEEVRRKAGKSAKAGGKGGRK